MCWNMSPPLTSEDERDIGLANANHCRDLSLQVLARCIQFSNSDDFLWSELRPSGTFSACHSVRTSICTVPTPRRHPAFHVSISSVLSSGPLPDVVWAAAQFDITRVAGHFAVSEWATVCQLPRYRVRAMCSMPMGDNSIPILCLCSSPQPAPIGVGLINPGPQFLSECFHD